MNPAFERLKTAILTSFNCTNPVDSQRHLRDGLKEAEAMSEPPAPVRADTQELVERLELLCVLHKAKMGGQTDPELRQQEKEHVQALTEAITALTAQQGLPEVVARLREDIAQRDRELEVFHGFEIGKQRIKDWMAQLARTEQERDALTAENAKAWKEHDAGEAVLADIQAERDAAVADAKRLAEALQPFKLADRGFDVSNLRERADSEVVYAAITVGQMRRASDALAATPNKGEK